MTYRCSFSSGPQCSDQANRQQRQARGFRSSSGFPHYRSGRQVARKRAERRLCGVEIYGEQRIGAGWIFGVDDTAIRLEKHERELIRRATRVHICCQAEIEGQQTARRERRRKDVQKGAVDERHAGDQVAAYTARRQRRVDGTRAPPTEQEIAQRDRVIGVARTAAVDEYERKLERSGKRRRVEADCSSDEASVRWSLHRGDDQHQHDTAHDDPACSFHGFSLHRPALPARTRVA